MLAKHSLQLRKFKEECGKTGLPGMCGANGGVKGKQPLHLETIFRNHRFGVG